MKIVELKTRVSLAGVISADIPLKPSGAEFKACCPFHGEKTPSFTVYTDEDGNERYKCFSGACGKAGDVLDWLRDYRGMTEPEALKELRRLAGDNPPRQAVARPDKWVAVLPKPNQAPPAELWSEKHKKRLHVVQAWAYRLADGALMAYVCRLEHEGKKEIVPVQWAAEGGWRQRAFAKPRPLYGLELLANDDGNVLLVEGEKATDAGRVLLPLTLVLTWPGGSSAVDYVDWSPLAGRKVVLWPDCDSKTYPEGHELAGEFLPYNEQPGQKAMLKIAAKLLALNCQVRIVQVPEPGGEWLDGFDLADAQAAGWGEQDVRGYLADHLNNPDIEPELPNVANDAPPLEENPLPEWQLRPPFLYLGFNEGNFYYLPTYAGQIVRLTAQGHTPSALGQLAPKDWWDTHYTSETKKGGSKTADWLAAAIDLMQKSKRFGLFNISRVRGRGAWWDNGRVVVHLGDMLLVDGVRMELTDIESRYIYPYREAWRVDVSQILSNAEAHKLVEICALPRWERPVSGLLLAGWLALSAVAGALEYRPSIWVLGGVGSGKTTVQDRICRPMLGGVVISCAANSTEAGIRQMLAGDAISVMFDEFESDDKNQSQQSSDVLRMVKVSATDNGSGVVKGSASGVSQTYVVRSMFAFFSVLANTADAAVLSRVSVLDLLNHGIDEVTTEDFNATCAYIDSVLTPEYVERLRARMINLIPIIRHNAKVFKTQGSERLGMSRLGDQVGTLLAGAYALHSNHKITPEAAREWLAKQDWSNEQSAKNEEASEWRCLTHIMGHVVQRITTKSGGLIDRSVAELVAIVDYQGDGKVDRDEAKEVLERLGIRVDVRNKTLMVANNNSGLTNIMKNSVSPQRWRVPLARLPGAEKSKKPLPFAKVNSQYVEIPLSIVFNGSDDEQEV